MSRALSDHRRVYSSSQRLVASRVQRNMISLASKGPFVTVQSFETDLRGVVILEPRVFKDERGFFFESYSARSFRDATGLDAKFVQDNHSRSSSGVLRGLHYQISPRAQGKLVRVVVGTVFDVAVDVRASSNTFGRWVGLELSATARNQLWIPPGFAHGFLSLSDRAEVLYKTTDYYSRDHERSIRWDDPTIGIEWPRELINRVIVSDKDSDAPPLKDAEFFL
jgi:dTDP-4-dehydrorhamnose 3,5-epimerase